MSGAVFLAGAVGGLVAGLATAVLWLDRRGPAALMRTTCVAAAAGLVVVTSARAEIEQLIGWPGEFSPVNAWGASVWMAGVVTALAVAGILGWLAAPVEGVALGAVAAAAAGAGLGVGGGEFAAVNLAPLRVGWLVVAGAWVGCGVSWAGLRRFGMIRVAAGAGAVIAGWAACWAVLHVQLVWGHHIAESAALATASGLVAMGAVAAIAWLGHRLEARILIRELTEEAGFGVIPAAMIEQVAGLSARLRSDWWPRADERRRLAATLTELALRKHRLRGTGADQGRLDSLLVGRIRARLRACLAGDCRDPGEV